MADPSARTTVTIGDIRFNAASVHFGVASVSDGLPGMPMMGSGQMTVTIMADMHDTKNLPFSAVRDLFALTLLPKKTDIRDIQIAFWSDETQQDALAVYKFRGWLSRYFVMAEAGTNHTLHLSIQPALDQQQFMKVDVSN